MKENRLFVTVSQVSQKIEKRHWTALLYIVTLLPVFLPWCYFEEEVDGIKYGTDIVNHALLLSLVALTLISILLARKEKIRKITKMLLLMHAAIYLFYLLFWYVPLVTDFDLILSLESAHFGVYLSLLCSGLMYLFYARGAKRGWYD